MHCCQRVGSLFSSYINELEMSVNAADFIRLNKKITELLDSNDKLMVRNTQLTRENAQLAGDVEKYKTDFMLSSAVNLKLKRELENITIDRDNLNTAHQKQKKKFVSLIEKCRQQFDRINDLELAAKKQVRLSPAGLAMLQPTATAAVPTANRVTIIGSISDLDVEMKLKQQLISLQEMLAKKNEQLAKAHGCIEELEFEVDEIDYLELENLELRRQLKSMSNATESDTLNSFTVIEQLSMESSSASNKQSASPTDQNAGIERDKVIVAMNASDKLPVNDTVDGIADETKVVTKAIPSSSESEDERDSERMARRNMLLQQIRTLQQYSNSPQIPDSSFD